jgi:LysR family transcriptional regulator, transcriptional activator for bauABCD operon
MRRLLDVDIRLFRIFRVIVECQGLAAAEPVLHLSQSRISASLAELEARLGVRLCRRGRSGFALTEAGEEVYRASHDLFEALERFCNQAGTVAAGLKRVLRLGTVDAVVTNADLSLTEVLRGLRLEMPELLIDFITTGPEELERALVAGTRDLIIVPTSNRRSELEYRKILEERQSLYCASGHPLFDRADIDITEDDLESAAFVARGYLHQYDLRRIGHRSAEATVETMEAQLVLILTGTYVGYLPTHYAAPWQARGDIRCIKENELSYASTFYAVTQRNGSENPVIRRVLAMLEPAPGRRKAR